MGRRPVDGMHAAEGRTRRGDSSTSAARRRWFILLAALLAFSWQSILAETHRHFPSVATSSAGIATRGVGINTTPAPAPYDAPADCPICRELAHLAFYLPPPPVVFTPPQAIVALLGAASLVFLTLRRRSLGWRSRAPPLLLQA